LFSDGGSTLKSRAYIFAAVFLAGLASAAFAAGTKDPETLQTSALNILENILQGTSQGDYNLYARNFSSIMKQAQDREAFLLLQRNLQRHLGKLNSVEYLGFYRQLGQIITLFKANFSKEKDDVLIKLVLEDKNGEFRVTGLWFDAPSMEK
jgi:hypothetical protein